MTESLLTLSFPDNIIFLEKLIFILYPISLPAIKATEYLSISWTTQRRLSTCLELFLARSNLLLVTGLLLVVPVFTSDEVTEFFDLQIYYKSTSTKECKCCHKQDSFFELQGRTSGIIKSGS